MSVIYWFESPVAAFKRAQYFYGTVMNRKLHVDDLRETMGRMLGVFPHDGPVGGGIDALSAVWIHAINARHPGLQHCQR